MKYRLAGATYRVIAEKLTEERAQAYADAKGISIDRAMKKIQHVSTKTAWDDVTAEMEDLLRETELQRGDLMALENARLDQLFSKALSLFVKGSVPAGRLAVLIMGRRAKLNGIDAPTKIACIGPLFINAARPQMGDPSTVRLLARHRMRTDGHVGVDEDAAGTERPVNACIEPAFAGHGRHVVQGERYPLRATSGRSAAARVCSALGRHRGDHSVFLKIISRTAATTTHRRCRPSLSATRR